jgi:hypothetical protein
VGRSSVSIGTARYYKGKAIGNSELVSLWQRKESLVGSGRSQLVSGVRSDQCEVVLIAIVICV